MKKGTSNIERPTSNNVFCQFKKAAQSKNHPSRFDSAEWFDPEFMTEGLTTEGLVAGCGLPVLKSIKRSVINTRRSMLGVRCSTFNPNPVSKR